MQLLKLRRSYRQDSLNSLRLPLLRLASCSACKATHGTLISSIWHCISQALLKQHASLLQAQRVLEHEKLVELVHHPLGLHHGRPMIAMLIARYVSDWKL
jgi:hypothetical protein